MSRWGTLLCCNFFPCRTINGNGLVDSFNIYLFSFSFWLTIITVNTIISHLTTLVICRKKKKTIRPTFGLVTWNDQKNLGSNTLSKVPLCTLAEHCRKQLSRDRGSCDLCRKVTRKAAQQKEEILIADAYGEECSPTLMIIMQIKAYGGQMGVIATFSTSPSCETEGIH